MSFGKDYRLVGEATVTGEKYRAGTTFWSSLAHTDIVGRIKRMVEHYAIVGEYIDKPLTYDRDELIAWLTSRVSNCLECYPYYVPGEEGEEFDLRKRKTTKDPLRFMHEFFAKMKELGLGWREFQLYYAGGINRYFLRNPESNEQDWDEKAILRYGKFDGQDRPDNLFGSCITPERFVDILDEIGANRRRLHELPVASK